MKNRIKELRKKRITQAKLIENMDISRQYISLLEKNEIEPSMKVANEIARELGTNKPPAMQVSQHCFSLQKKTSGGIINVGSPTALIYTGGIHMDNNSLSHTKWNCKYHIVFAPKYRRKVAYGKIKQDIADILSMLCKRKGVKIVEAEICPDHVHMLVEIPPSISVSYFVGYLKGKSTLMIFAKDMQI